MLTGSGSCREVDNFSIFSDTELTHMKMGWGRCVALARVAGIGHRMPGLLRLHSMCHSRWDRIVCAGSLESCSVCQGAGVPGITKQVLGYWDRTVDDGMLGSCSMC